MTPFASQKMLIRTLPAERAFRNLIGAGSSGLFHAILCCFDSGSKWYSVAPWYDLAPSDFHLFSNLKRDMRAIHFNRDEEVKNFVENWLSEKAQNFFLDGINNLKVRLEKCISNLGGYVEK